MAQISRVYNKNIFISYLLGLILQEKRFSTLAISERTKAYTYNQFSYYLKETIKWNKIYYELAKFVIEMFPEEEWYLVGDGSPLKQIDAKKRVTRSGHKDIPTKNTPQNELICLSLTNGKIFIPLDFYIWVSPKVEDSKVYRKKTDVFLALLKKYNLMNIPVKEIVFDNFFASKEIMEWLNGHGYTQTTRFKENRVIKKGEKKQVLRDVLTENGESTVAMLKNQNVLYKIIRFQYQDEDIFIATNDTASLNMDLVMMYQARWKVEEFHRDAKQHLGLEYYWVRHMTQLTNHVGFVCLAFALLSVLRDLFGGSIGFVKKKIHNIIYQQDDAIDRLLHCCIS